MEREDFEYESRKDEIYHQEIQREFEREYWEWYEKTTGKVIIENADGTKTEIDETISESKLPF
jgi:hypothetical protein